MLTPLMSEAPWKFKEELFMKVAQALGMPVEELREALTEQGKVVEEKDAMAMEQQKQMTEGGAIDNQMAKMGAPGAKTGGAAGPPKPMNTPPKKLG